MIQQRQQDFVKCAEDKWAKGRVWNATRFEEGSWSQSAGHQIGPQLWSIVHLYGQRDLSADCSQNPHIPAEVAAWPPPLWALSSSSCAAWFTDLQVPGSGLLTHLSAIPRHTALRVMLRRERKDYFQCSARLVTSEDKSKLTNKARLVIHSQAPPWIPSCALTTYLQQP